MTANLCCHPLEQESGKKCWFPIADARVRGLGSISGSLNYSRETGDAGSRLPARLHFHVRPCCGSFDRHSDKGR
jgi:hypothetical protein